MKSKTLIIKNLAEGVNYLNSIKLPDDVINVAKKLIIDICGVTLAGSNTSSTNLIFDSALGIYSSGKCTIIGKNKTLNSSGAAFVNGASAHSLDFDDNCYAGVVHASAVVFPAVLAFAQENSLSGSALLKSFIIGLEIEFAIARSLSNKIYDKGWWTTSVLGSAGSTAGVASLAKLKTNEVENALSLAISGVGAIRAVRGTNSKHYYCGKAAESGIIISSLSIKGATGPLEVFEDRNGIINVINDKDFNYDYIERIGKDFSIITPGVDIKKYPVCYASHAAVDGINSIVKSEKIKINDVKKIVCGVPPIIESNLTYNDPKNAKEAQFSIQFAIAMIIKFGSIKLEHLNNEYIFDTSIQILMKKIFMNVEKLPKKINFEDNICPEWSNVQLYTNDGNFFEKFIGAPIGSASSPLTNNMLFDKFQSCLKFSKFDKEPKKLYDKLFNIEKLKNCRDLFKT